MLQTWSTISLFKNSFNGLLSLLSTNAVAACIATCVLANLSKAFSLTLYKIDSISACDEKNMGLQTFFEPFRDH